MSELLYLSTDDFEIKQGQKGPILCCKLESLSLILYYSTDCVHCKPLLPKFRNLTSIVSGCKFGIVNLSKNTKLIYMSKTTIDPINYVPYIVLYVNGSPFLRYDGNMEESDLRKFILDAIANIRTTKNYHVSTSEFSYGKPLRGQHDKKRCYLTNENAYKT